MGQLEGMRALVTAAGSGIGRVIAERLRAEGAAVFACDIDAQALEGLPSGIGRLACDVGHEQAVEALFQAADAHLGGLDILVACAGTAGPIGPIEGTEAGAWRACLDVSVMGSYLCARAAVPRLTQAGGGSIITFSSNAGLFGYPHRTAYCAAKWAVIGFTKALAAEVGARGIRVNAICPGVVEGERMERVIAAEAATRGIPEETLRDAYVEGNSLRQWVRAEDLADMALFLSTSASSRITGQAMVVDGQTEAR